MGCVWGNLLFVRFPFGEFLLSKCRSNSQDRIVFQLKISAVVRPKQRRLSFYSPLNFTSRKLVTAGKIAKDDIAFKACLPVFSLSMHCPPCWFWRGVLCQKRKQGFKSVLARYTPFTSNPKPRSACIGRCGALAFHGAGQGRGGVPVSISGQFKCRWTPCLKSGRAVLSP